MSCRKISEMLQTEEVEGVLKGGERAVGLGKSGFQMSEDLGFGPV